LLLLYYVTGKNSISQHSPSSVLFYIRKVLPLTYNFRNLIILSDTKTEEENFNSTDNDFDNRLTNLCYSDIKGNCDQCIIALQLFDTCFWLTGLYVLDWIIFGNVCVCRPKNCPMNKQLWLFLALSKGLPVRGSEVRTLFLVQISCSLL
jgi:hypothetical protein